MTVISSRYWLREHLFLAWFLAKWIVLGSWVGVLAGSSSAIFLISLDWATATRERLPWLLFFLPLAGAAIGWIYSRFGRDVEGGNNLLLDRIHDPGEAVPWRMAPLIALSTVGTHLFGGSAGREGTAVQMGGSLAGLISKPLRLRAEDRRMVLMSGVSGGFGAVFGTPLAGMVFGLEVLSVGRIRHDAIVPCFTASVVGDLVCRALGIHHHLYPAARGVAITPGLLMWVGLAGVAFGAASLIFSELTHAVAHAVKELVKPAWGRPIVGGALVIALTALVGNRDYLGLSLPMIERSFTPGGVVAWAFLLKIVFTAVTLGSGFKGGEVTPLFAIGASLGSAFATMLGLPVGVFAAVGFVAVFASAANTPLACIFMGIELFGAELAVPIALGCIVSYIVSGHRGIYLSQRLDTPKTSSLGGTVGAPLREARPRH